MTKNIDEIMGKEVEIMMLTTIHGGSFTSTLEKWNFPETITLQDNNGPYKIHFIGATGGIKEIRFGGEIIYSNPKLNGRYPRGFSDVGIGLVEMNKFRRECFGEDYAF